MPDAEFGLSLRDRILSARSVESLNVIIEESKTFHLASDKTRRQWKVAASKKLADLKNETEPKTEKPKAVPAEDTTKKRGRPKKKVD